MSNIIEMELVREVLNHLVKAKEWLESSTISGNLKCQDKEVQSAISLLYKGGYILRIGSDEGKKSKIWKYRLNPDLDVKQIESLAKAALTAQDFVDLSPIPLEDRPSFKYQQRAEVLLEKEAIDLAKQKGDMQLENLEGLAIASANAYQEYIELLMKKDKKLASLRQMSQGCEKAFWNYVQKLPRA